MNAPRLVGTSVADATGEASIAFLLPTILEKPFEFRLRRHGFAARSHRPNFASPGPICRLARHNRIKTLCAQLFRRQRELRRLPAAIEPLEYDQCPALHCPSVDTHTRIRLIESNLNALTTLKPLSSNASAAKMLARVSQYLSLSPPGESPQAPLTGPGAQATESGGWEHRVESGISITG